jgi:hypothetical protein
MQQQIWERCAPAPTFPSRIEVMAPVQKFNPTYWLQAWADRTASPEGASRGWKVAVKRFKDYEFAV